MSKNETSRINYARSKPTSQRYGRKSKAIPSLEEEFDQIVRRADRGDVNAQYTLGFLYLNGVNTECDFAKALLWFQRAAEQNHANAHYHIGSMYENGLGVDEDYTKAFEFYERAAQLGDSAGQTAVARMYYCSYASTTATIQKSIEWYEKAASQGDVYAMNCLGWIYSNGSSGVEVFDLAKAFQWYLQSADAGDPEGQFHVAQFLEYGWGVSIDIPKAFEWYEKAASSGDVAAQAHLGNAYYYGTNAPQDYHKARFWLEKAADQDDALSQTTLGWMYDNGMGMKPDRAKAQSLYEQAADKNEAYAMDNLGWLYLQERTTAGGSPTAARQYFLNATEIEDIPYSFYGLGYMYANGFVGVEKEDAHKAAELFIKKAQDIFDKNNSFHAHLTNAIQGFELDQFWTGILYLHGWGGARQDHQLAAEWLGKAAAKGNAISKILLEQAQRGLRKEEEPQPQPQPQQNEHDVEELQAKLKQLMRENQAYLSTLRTAEKLLQLQQQQRQL